MKPISYPITNPSEALKRAKLDNIALVLASLLSQKGTYQPIANRLPTGSVLCVPASQRQQKIMAKVTSFLRSHGRQVIILPIERIAKKIQKPRPHAENLPLAF